MRYLLLMLLCVSLYGNVPSSIPGNRLIVQVSDTGEDDGDDSDSDADDDEDVIIMDDDDDVNN